MRAGLVVIACAAAAWLLWPRAPDAPRNPAPRAEKAAAPERAREKTDAPAAAPTVADLVTILESGGDGAVAAQAIHALIARGPAAADAVPALIRHLRGDEPHDEIVFQAFASIGPAARDALPAIAESLRAFERHKEEYERTHRGVNVSWANLGFDAGEAVVHALVHIGAPAIAPLEAALGSDDARVRRRATAALSRLGRAGEAMIPAYERQLDSDDPDERVAAAIALARHGARADRALPHLQRFLEGEKYTRHEEALHAIVNAVGRHRPPAWTRGCRSGRVRDAACPATRRNGS